MGKHLTKFTDKEVYDAGEKDYPNVSLLDDGTVLYMPHIPLYSDGEPR